MKTIKTIAALCIIGALFISCPINDADEHGTLIINLPGSDSARTAVHDFTQLNYRIECSKGADTVTRDAGAGVAVSIALLPGAWTITLTVMDANGEKIGRGTGTADIESGRITPVSIPVTVDQYPYLGETLWLSGQTYGGESENNNLDTPRRGSADVYAEDDIGGDGAIKTIGTKNGQLEFTIGKPELLQPLFTDEDESEDEQAHNMFDNFTVIPDNALGAFLHLRAIGGQISSTNTSRNQYALRNKITTTNESTTVTESVEYLYVDRDVRITAQNNTYTDYDGNAQVTATMPAFTLSLKKGWNAVYVKEEETGDTKTINIALGNPPLKWVLEKYGNPVNGTVGELEDIPFTMVVGTSYTKNLSRNQTHYYRFNAQKDVVYAVYRNNNNITVTAEAEEKNAQISTYQSSNPLLSNYLVFSPGYSGKVIIKVQQISGSSYEIKLYDYNNLPDALKTAVNLLLNR